MRRLRFKFSTMLTDHAEVLPIKLHLDRVNAEGRRHQEAMGELQGQFDDLLINLRARHRIPRGLTIVIDPNHMSEHGVVFVNSQETEEFEDGLADESETRH